MSNRSPVTWTLREIARLERGGLRPVRLTEANHERWHRVRRKLGWVAFIDLLHEDLAEAFPTSFAFDRWSRHPTVDLDDTAARALIDEAIRADCSDRLTFLRLAARGLGLMDGGNVAVLPKVQPHQRALVLAGCGGRIAAHQVTSHSGLSFHEHLTFVADTDAERVAIGVAAAELRANAPKILSSADVRATKPKFDHRESTLSTSRGPGRATWRRSPHPPSSPCRASGVWASRSPCPMWLRRDEVLKKCRTEQDIAIAHDRLDLYQPPPQAPRRGRGPRGGVQLNLPGAPGGDGG